MIDAKYLVVGSGIFGSVVAERIASQLGEPVTIVEKRSHVGGNCYSSIDTETGIECHRYGSHIFHTSSEKVWSYITKFTDFTSYRHRVMTISDGQVYFMPINLKTLCDVYQKSLTPTDAEKILSESLRESEKAGNLEEKAIALIGKTLYEKFIRGYTFKQWNKDPRELPADIINRLPVRTNFNTDYFNDPFQGIPLGGYLSLFNRLLSDKKISILLNTDFSSIRNQVSKHTKIIYTGMIDEFFDYSLGHLEWRSLNFEWETCNVRDFQGTSVVNYADLSVPYTRIHEFKHYHPERTEPFASLHTVICREYSKNWTPGQEAFYPVNTDRNQKLLAEYQQMAQNCPNLIFGGRLGCYRYWDMDKAVLAALNCFETQVKGK